MGSSKSKLSILSYEDAEKRLNEKELNRLKRAFQLCAPRKLLSYDKFCSEVFGTFLPSLVTDLLFKALSVNNNPSGINFKELLIGIIILTRGSFDEKCKFFFNLYCNENGTAIDLPYLQYAMDRTTSNEDKRSIAEYLDENSSMSLDNYMKWIRNHTQFNEISRWLLTAEFQLPTFTDDSIPLDLYQLVAGVTHLDELEIIELERTYQRSLLRGSNKLDFITFKQLVCPPLMENVVENVFQAFDDNDDGIIDFHELACGISACCRGPMIERKKFCCKVFNKNKNGIFRSSDIEYLFEICEEIKAFEELEKSKSKSTLNNDLMKSILCSKDMLAKQFISIDDLMIWINNCDFLDRFLNIMNQICMVVFGLKPKHSQDEEQAITQWLLREQKMKTIQYDHLFLVSRVWLNQWMDSIRSNMNNDSPKNGSTKSNTKLAHSISMNNVFNRKHQYDLTKGNKSPNYQKDQTTGRFIYHAQLSDCDSVVDNIYPDLTSSNDLNSCTGSSNSIPSFSSNTSSQEFSRTSKLGTITNQYLLQSNSSKYPSNVTNLTDDGGVLLSNIKLNEDYELLPPPIWNCMQAWYGVDTTIKRPVWIEQRNSDAETNEDDEHFLTFKRYQSLVKVEIHLLTIVIMRHVIPTTLSAVNVLPALNQFSLPNIGLSGGSLNALTGSVYKELTSTKRQIAYRASFSHRTRLIELLEFLSKKLRINREEMRIWKIVDDNNLTLLDDEDKTLQAWGLQNFDKILVEQRNIDLTWPEELNQLVTLKALHNKKASVNRGVTGLSNIGNTCFFNSAIQCISNTNVLTDYFIRDAHLCEINKNNPQGCQGIVALRYGELIKDIWTGSTNLIVPLKLKMTLDKYSKQFSANQQHDAQELLSVLLDALHEDLNRVDVKPSYKKLKDSDGRHDEEVAQEAWQAHIETNYSIIVDLFHGLLKSNVSCDICKTNSVRFDAYSMLSLPIPMQLNQDFEILVFQHNSSSPKRHCVVFNTSDSTASFICQQLSSLLSIDESLLLLATIEDNKIKRFLNNTDRIFISQTLFAYVLDDQCLPVKKASDGASSHDHLVKFIVYHRKLTQKTNYFIAQSRLISELYGYPMLFAVNRSDIDKLTNGDVQDKIDQIINQQFTDCNTHQRTKNSLSNSISKPNHAVDCDSVNHRHPFIISQVTPNAKHCSICHWTKFCHGCPLSFNSETYNYVEIYKDEQYLAIDWSLTSWHVNLHLDANKRVTIDDQCKKIKSSNSQPMDLIKCIESFITPETLDNETPYQCYKCKKPQPAHKKLDLWTLPPILIIHLKRFQFLDKRWQKSHKIVHYPIRNLDLNKFLERDNNNNITVSPTSGDGNISASNIVQSNAIYNLYAVNCHLGNLQMGHYVTYARNRETNKWYLFNDSMCKEVDEKEIAMSCAYLLFYERADVDSSKFLNPVLSKVNNITPQAIEIISDEVDSDIKKYCVLQ